jgi:hypothetical protein
MRSERARFVGRHLLGKTKSVLTNLAYREC